MNVLTSTEALPRVSMFVHTWQQHLSACTMSHANTVNIMKEWWIDPPRTWRVFSPRNTRCIDVHICECTTSEIDASELSKRLWCQFRIGVFQSCGHCKSHEWVVDRSTEDLASFLASWHEVWHNTKDSSLSLWLYLLSHSALTNADVIYDLLAPRHVYLNHRTSVVFTTSPNEANAAAGHILNPLSVASNGTFTDANLAMRFCLPHITKLPYRFSGYALTLYMRWEAQGHTGSSLATWSKYGQLVSRNWRDFPAASARITISWVKFSAFIHVISLI
mgnify:FL=1